MKNVATFVFVMLILAACSSPATPISEPTLLQQPTNTPIPVFTATLTPPTVSPSSPTPELSQNDCLSDDSLRSLACRRNFLIGSAVRSWRLSENPEYAETLAREFNLMTDEYMLKFTPIHPEPDVYDFEMGDLLMDFAEQNDMQIRGHTLIWHIETPDWVNDGDWTREQLIEIMREHIHTVVGRYKDHIAFWDVINEGIDDESLQLFPSKWMEVIGAEYVELAFQFAHEADPDALLFYNDYGGEGLGEKSDAIYMLLKDLRSRNVPVHGVGLQMHVTIDDYPSQSELRANIRRLAELGLIVHITEMDVAIPEPVTPENFNQQAEIYRSVLEVCLSEPACQAFVTWGYTDKYSWISETDYPQFQNLAAGCLFDSLLQPKPAYYAVHQELEK